MEIQPKDTSRGRFYVSAFKRWLRIIAGLFLMKGDFFVAGAVLIAAEVLGILEEVV
jgi:hypothetical protein